MFINVPDQLSTTLLNLDHVVSITECWNGETCELTTIDGTEYTVNSSLAEFMARVGLRIPSPVDAST